LVVRGILFYFFGGGALRPRRSPFFSGGSAGGFFSAGRRGIFPVRLFLGRESSAFFRGPRWMDLPRGFGPRWAGGGLLRSGEFSPFMVFFRGGDKILAPFFGGLGNIGPATKTFSLGEPWGTRGTGIAAGEGGGGGGWARAGVFCGGGPPVLFLGDRGKTHLAGSFVCFCVFGGGGALLFLGFCCLPPFFPLRGGRGFNWGGAGVRLGYPETATGGRAFAGASGRRAFWAFFSPGGKEGPLSLVPGTAKRGFFSPLWGPGTRGVGGGLNPRSRGLFPGIWGKKTPTGRGATERICPGDRKGGGGERGGGAPEAPTPCRHQKPGGAGRADRGVRRKRGGGGGGSGGDPPGVGILFFFPAGTRG